jgi:tetratricopeptide (TPR) repeat protein
MGVPLPSYEDKLVTEAWREANVLLEAGHPEAAAEVAQKFEDEVTPAGSLEYLIGLSFTLRGLPIDAEAHYKKAIELDPKQAEAWYDLGELQLADGRFDDAKGSFTHVAELVPTGPTGWLGPWRLAEICAHEHDAQCFEDNLRIAVDKGFSFDTIAGLPNWQGFYADPALHDSVEKMLTVNGRNAKELGLTAPP